MPVSFVAVEVLASAASPLQTPHVAFNAAPRSLLSFRNKTGRGGSSVGFSRRGGSEECMDTPILGVLCVSRYKM